MLPLALVTRRVVPIAYGSIQLLSELPLKFSDRPRRHGRCRYDSVSFLAVSDYN